MIQDDPLLLRITKKDSTHALKWLNMNQTTRMVQGAMDEKMSSLPSKDSGPSENHFWYP